MAQRETADSQKGKQELRLTFEFINHDDPSVSQKNEMVFIDTPGVIALIQAGAIDPAFKLMADRFTAMSAAKAVNANSSMAEFLASLD